MRRTARTASSFRELVRVARHLLSRLGIAREQLGDEDRSGELRRQPVETVTERMNRAVELAGEGVEPAVEATAREALARVEW